jgi:two-component system osmolarity sensor histidine kinase EnvZ
MNRLLRPFERLDKARGNEGGSGLGLAIADRIAKLHKGELTLLNRPQGGLEARLTLPITP